MIYHPYISNVLVVVKHNMESCLSFYRYVFYFKV